MALSVKTVFRSILESMLFLAVLGTAITVLSAFPGLKKILDMPTIVYFPVLTAGASAVVAFAFPKPTFWTAFIKLFIGGLLTLAIFSIVSVAAGAAGLEFLSTYIWDAGVGIWKWASGGNIAAGILAILFYVIILAFFIASLFAALFALINFLVLLVMNSLTHREEPQQPS